MNENLSNVEIEKLAKLGTKERKKGHIYIPYEMGSHV